jgi:hypothetical protein
LDCAEKNTEFYQKCGFSIKGIQMSIYYWLKIIYDTGNAARQSLIEPRLATLYLTTRGKSFSK